MVTHGLHYAWQHASRPSPIPGLSTAVRLRHTGKLATPYLHHFPRPWERPFSRLSLDGSKKINTKRRHCINPFYFTHEKHTLNGTIQITTIFEDGRKSRWQTEMAPGNAFWIFFLQILVEL